LSGGRPELLDAGAGTLPGDATREEVAAVEPLAMWLVAGALVALPFVLIVVLVGRDRADSGGRRVNRNWYVRKQRI
jgi:hypothetical protein